jgi:hypothetical protein
LETDLLPLHKKSSLIKERPFTLSLSGKFATYLPLNLEKTTVGMTEEKSSP